MHECFGLHCVHKETRKNGARLESIDLPVGNDSKKTTGDKMKGCGFACEP